MKHEKKKKLTRLQKKIRILSDQIVEAQRPIQILNAIKWNGSIKEYFFKHKFKKLPPVNKSYYESVKLGFNPEKKIQEFFEIEHRIKRYLGPYTPISQLMQDRCTEYLKVIDFLNARGTKKFFKISRELYGSTDEPFYEEAPSLKDMAASIAETLKNIGLKTHNEKDIPKYSAQQAVKILRRRLKTYFGKESNIKVRVSDNIISDAAAGSDILKLRKNVKFSDRGIRLYEVHEGWVHMGTTLNGAEQAICTFLSKGPPSVTIIQEGLAVLTELFTLSSYPDRVKRLTNRILALNMAENGANFIEVFNFFREQGYSDEGSYNSSVRIFRGSTPEQGPFTKDISYSKGLILIYNYIRLVMKRGDIKRLYLLFVGKISLENIHLISELLEEEREELVTLPKYIPPQFKDLAGLSAWSSYSLFFNQLKLDELVESYHNIL